MNSTDEIELAYKMIQGLFPGLVTVRNCKLYLIDTTIIKRDLYVKISSSRIDLISYHMILSLYTDPDNLYGFLTTNHDFKLSDRTCLELYKHNISVKYYVNSLDMDMDMDMVMYDMVSIARRCTINDIVS